MRWIRFAVLLIIFSLLQAEAIKMFDFGGVRPNLMIISLVFFAIYSDSYDAIITSFCIGFAADVIGESGSMGVCMLSFGILGVTLSGLHEVIEIRKMVHQGLAIFTISMLAGLVGGILYLVVRQPVQGDLSNLFFVSLYSAVVGPFLFLPSAWAMGIRSQRY
jgi:rod shape-determining protein MreD